jgi:hypothetical protein
MEEQRSSFCSCSTWHICLLASLLSSPQQKFEKRSMHRGLNVVKRIDRNTSVLFLCDIQERFRPLIHQMDAVINRSILMNRAAATLEIPCIVTEQYSKVFGKTVPELVSFPGTQTFEKKQFSMMTPEVSTALTETGRKQV